MEDSTNNTQPSKKRAAGVQLSRDNPGLDDDEETPEQEAGTFMRASDEVLATRRIVKVRRQQTASVPSAANRNPSSNPFAAIRLAPTAPPVKVETSSVITTEESESKVGDSKAEKIETDEVKVGEPKAEPNTEKIETDEVIDSNITKSVVKVGAEGSGNEAGKSTEADLSLVDAKNDVEGKGNDEEKHKEEAATEKIAETSSVSSFQQLSSGQNAFSGLARTGFSSTVFSFGSVTNESSLRSNTGSLFGGFGVSNNGNSIFGASGASIVTKSESSSKFTSMKEVPLETGEENETAVFTADSVLFEFIDGLWKERGKGELKVNISKMENGRARLVMRARGNYRLILNAGLFPDMKLTNMDKKGVTFACINSAGEGRDGLSTIALKFRDASILEDFKAAVMDHKANKSPVALKTPENSPKASDE